MDGRARSVCTEQMLMILPEPRASWCRATSRPTRKALVRSVVMTRFQSSRLTSSSGCRCCRPGVVDQDLDRADAGLDGIDTGAHLVLDR